MVQEETEISECLFAPVFIPLLKDKNSLIGQEIHIDDSYVAMSPMSPFGKYEITANGAVTASYKIGLQI